MMFPRLTPSGFRLFIKKISDSKKEIQIGIIDNNLSNYDVQQFDIPKLDSPGETIKVPASQFYSRLNITINNILNDDFSDVVIPIGEGKYIPVVGSLYSTTQGGSSINRYMLVLKLNESLPASIKKLDVLDISIIKTEFIKQDVYYGGKRENVIEKFGNALHPDFSVSPNPYTSVTEYFEYENFNQLTESIGPQKLKSALSSSYRDKLNDYTDFNNFVFFGSAEKKLKNFKTKLEAIEVEQNKVSQSLFSLGNSLGNATFSPDEYKNAKDIRQQARAEINSIVNGFTDYESFLYQDHQRHGSGSAPGLGLNYLTPNPLTLSDNIKKRVDFEEFPVAFILSGSSSQKINFTTDKYKVQDIPFNNSSGSFYLSFLMKASSSFEQRFIHRNAQTSSRTTYPFDSLHISKPLFPSATGSEYRRYVFLSSASFWIPTNADASVGHPVNGNLDFSDSSDDVKIIPPNSPITGSLVSAHGSYKNLLTTPGNSGTKITGSFVPRGDLFDIVIEADSATTSSAIITDLKLTKESPIDILPFSNLYPTTSTKFITWYNGMIDSASFYDSQNIHRLYNNIPPSYHKDESHDNHDLLQYVDMVGEFYDEYKVLIDDYYRLFNQGYSDYEKVPPQFNQILAENLGFNLFTPQSGSILAKFGLFDESFTELSDYNSKLYNNILNNLNYLYKTKGTQNSIKALLNCYGLPSNVLRIKESGQNLKSYDQSFLNNNTNLTAVDALSNMTGSVTFEQNTIDLKTLMISPGMDISMYWAQSQSIYNVTQSAVEAVFKITPTQNTSSLIQSLMTGSVSSSDLPSAQHPNRGLNWRIHVEPSGSTQPTKGRIRLNASFRTNLKFEGTNDAFNPNVFVFTTDYFDIYGDDQLVNVLFQRSSSDVGLHTISSTTPQVYELMVGSKKINGDEITYMTSSKANITQKSLARNLITTGSAPFGTNSLQFGSQKGVGFTGSIAEIRTWSKPLSKTAFKQHVYNPHNVVGNNYSSSLEDLVTHFRLQENYTSGSTGAFKIIDSSPSIKGKSFDDTFELDSNFFNSQSHHYDSTIVETFNFPSFGNGGGSVQYNDNTILIPDSFALKENLNWERSVIKQNHDLLNRDIVNTNNLDFSNSPQDVINDFLKDNLGNLDFNDLFADPRDDLKDTYSDLDEFNEKLINTYNVSVEVNKFINSIERLFDTSLVESIKKVIPARAKLNVGATLKPTYTQRIKFPPMQENPSIEHINHKGVLDDTTAFTPGEEFLPSEVSLENHDSKFENTSYPVHLNDDTLFLDAINYPERDFSKRPELTWGTGSDDTHFVSHYQAGRHNDYNTYYVETQDVFRMIGDIEYLSGSLQNGIPIFDYNSEKTFQNKKQLQTSEAVQKRDLGSTLQYVSTDSSSFGKLIEDNLRRPQNHITTFGGHSHMNLGRIYDGYQFRGDSDETIYVNSASKVKPITKDSIAGDILAHRVKKPGFSGKEGEDTFTVFEDLTTRAFYRIEVDTSGEANLTVRRRDDKAGEDYGQN